MKFHCLLLILSLLVSYTFSQNTFSGAFYKLRENNPDKYIVKVKLPDSSVKRAFFDKDTSEHSQKFYNALKLLKNEGVDNQLTITVNSNKYMTILIIHTKNRSISGFHMPYYDPGLGEWIRVDIWPGNNTVYEFVAHESGRCNVWIRGKSVPNAEMVVLENINDISSNGYEAFRGIMSIDINSLPNHNRVMYDIINSSYPPFRAIVTGCQNCFLYP